MWKHYRTCIKPISSILVAMVVVAEGPHHNIIEPGSTICFYQLWPKVFPSNTKIKFKWSDLSEVRVLDPIDQRPPVDSGIRAGRVWAKSNSIRRIPQLIFVFVKEIPSTKTDF